LAFNEVIAIGVTKESWDAKIFRERLCCGMTRIDVPNSARTRRSGNRFGRWMFTLVLLLIIAGGLWTWLTLAWAYAEGERAGVLQKFVRRGVLCKTYEGEIALYYGGGQYMGPGNSQQLWDFSVRDKSVADQFSKAVGHRVQLHYTEHPGVPTSCFADTRYFVDNVTITDNEPGTPGTALPNSPGANAPGSNPPGSNAQGPLTPAPAPPGASPPAPVPIPSDPASAAH
jgi:hypothetical protein